MSYTLFVVVLIGSGALAFICLVGLVANRYGRAFGLCLVTFLLLLAFFAVALYSYLTPTIYSTNRTTVYRYLLCPLDNTGGFYLTENPSNPSENRYRIVVSETETKLATSPKYACNIQFLVDNEDSKVYVIHETDLYLYDFLGIKIRSNKTNDITRCYFRVPADKADIR